MRKTNFLLGIAAFIILFGFRIESEPKKTIDTFSGRDSGNACLYTFPDSTAKRIFYASCYNCHKDSVASLAPGLTIMSAMTPRAILASLNTGKMRQQGAAISAEERTAVAEWITRTKIKTNTFPKNAYTPFSLTANTHTAGHSGWGNDKEGSGFRTTKQAGISAENVGSLKLKWAFAFPDATIVRSKPAIVGDWLIVGGQFGDVFALNRHTGKIGWQVTAGAAIRGAISIVKNGNAVTAFFADNSTTVYAVNVNTGKLIWSKRAGFDPQSSNTGSVVVYNGKVFVPISSIEVSSAANGNYGCCTSSGGVVALDAKTGNKIWQYRILPKAIESSKKKNGKPIYGPSGAPVWCSPTVDAKRGLLYIGTGENYSFPASTTSDAIQALDMKTGKLIWNFQATKGDMYNLACPYFDNCPDQKSPDFDFGMAPILVQKQDGKEILVAGQKSGIVYGVSPATGKVLWQTRIGKGGKLGGVHWGMATDKNLVYAANADNTVFGAIDTGDSSLQVSPGLYALDVANGKVIWKTPTPDCGKKDCLRANSAAPLVIPGVIFAGALDGHMRAYATSDGKILWDFDTVKEYETVDGIKGQGGAIDGPAPVVADGMLFVNSGYGMFGQMPGNVLLAFAIDGT